MTVSTSEIQTLLRAQDRYVERIQSIERQYEEGLEDDEEVVATVAITRAELKNILESADASSAALRRILTELKQTEQSTKAE